MTGSDVDDAQTAVAQADVLVDVDSLIVWTTMRDHIAHRFQRGSVDTAARPAGKRDSINSAHNLFCPQNLWTTKEFPSGLRHALRFAAKCTRPLLLSEGHGNVPTEPRSRARPALRLP